MGVPASLLPELEDVVQHGSAEKRAETLRRITTSFLDGVPSFNAEHVSLNLPAALRRFRMRRPVL